MSVLGLRSVFPGILATITVDVLTAAAYKSRFIAPLSPHVISRWLRLSLGGSCSMVMFSRCRRSITKWLSAASMHYTVGATLALVYLLACSALGLGASNPLSAFGFALCTKLLLWLLMFPAMGCGWFGARGSAGTDCSSVVS